VINTAPEARQMAASDYVTRQSCSFLLPRRGRPHMESGYSHRISACYMIVPPEPEAAVRFVQRRAFGSEASSQVRRCRACGPRASGGARQMLYNAHSGKSAVASVSISAAGADVPEWVETGHPSVAGQTAPAGSICRVLITRSHAAAPTPRPQLLGAAAGGHVRGSRCSVPRC